MATPADPAHIKESPYEKALAQIAQDKYRRYRRALRPVENQFMKQVDALDKPEQYERVGGMATAGVMNEIDPSLQSAGRQIAMQGIAPNSGAYTARMGDLRSKAARTQAETNISAKTGLQDIRAQGLTNIIGIGSNKASDAQYGMSALAQNAAERARQKMALDVEERSGLYNAAGTVAGLGIGAALSKR